MKITLDLPSVAAGGAVALVLGLVAGFSPQATSVSGAQNIAPTAPLGSYPAAGNLIYLEASSPGLGLPGQPSALFTVPPGKILVVSAVGNNRGGGAARPSLLLDGVARDLHTGSGGDGVMHFGVGWKVREGRTLQLEAVPGGSTSSPPYEFHWLTGYLADA